MKKAMKAALVIVMILAMGATVCPIKADAATTKNINKKQAKAIALKSVGTKASKIKNYRIKYDSDDGCYEIKFVIKKKCKRYSFDISKATGIIMEKDVDYKYRKTCSKKKIGKKAAIRKVIKISKFKASIVKSGTCKYRYRDHEGTYQVKFRKGNRIYEYEILAPNGKLKEIEYKYVGKAKK